MGYDASAELIYGIPLEECADLGDADTKGTPQWLYEHDKADGGVVVRHHGYCDQDDYIVAIGPRKKPKDRPWCEWGTPKDLTGFDLSRRPEWDEALRAFVKKHNLPTAGEPGWYLAASYG